MSILPFVQDTLRYFASNPEFAPPFIDLSELKKDFKLVNELTPLFDKVSQVHQNLNDTILLAGSEAYVACLAYYNSVKQAVKINIPNAKPIYEVLKQRFEKQSSDQPAPAPVPNP